jgi:hypothetical protein
VSWFVEVGDTRLLIVEIRFHEEVLRSFEITKIKIDATGMNWPDLHTAGERMESSENE